MFASVFDISELEVRREGERWMFAVALFSMPVASSELLELAMMVWKWGSVVRPHCIKSVAL